MPRGRISASFRAFAVIELPAGAAVRAGVRAGDRLEIVPGIPTWAH
jgi:hypothetical protein